MTLTKTDVARYVLLPGLVPRVRDLLRSPFAFLAALFAETMATARLLPRTHPYLAPDTYGQFGVLDVLRAGAANLRFDLRHIDQVLIYIAILAGWVSFLFLLITAAAYGVMSPALAQMPTSVGGLMANIYNYTSTPNPDKDIALMLLDRTLGITGSMPSGTFFGSAVPTMCPGGELAADYAAATGKACPIPPFPSALHVGMHSMLGFFSWAVFCFAALFLVYLLATVVMETSIKGKPFGARMNTFWAPLRLVFGIGLLIPIAPHGLNTAQYIVLYTAKVGSAFATNGWLYYQEFLETTMGATERNPVGVLAADTTKSALAAKLNAPDMGDLVRHMHIIATCEYYYERAYGTDVRGYFYRDGQAPLEVYTESGAVTHVSYADALKYYENGNIRIFFGVYDAAKYKDMKGLDPVCGELVVPVTSVDNPATPKIENPGAAIAHEYYYRYLMILWNKSMEQRQYMDGYARQMVENHAKILDGGACQYDKDNDGIQNDPGTNANLTELGKCTDNPPAQYMQWQIERFQSIFKTLIDNANAELAKVENFAMDAKVLDSGWAGAGIWYQHIASLNGRYVSAVQQIPYVARLPRVMEIAREVSGMSNANMVAVHKFFNLGPMRQKDGKGGNSGKSLYPGDEQLAIVLSQVNQNLKNDNVIFSFFPDPAGPAGVSGMNGYPINSMAGKTPNVVTSAINSVLGTAFLFDFRQNHELHPLAQLVTFGRTLLERSVRNLLTGSAIASAGGVISVGNDDISSGLRKLSSFFIIVASIMFSAGFMLFYVLPLLPFVYFFFAMLSWVKAIFEALIGAPLWAMAHIRLEGNGFPSGASRAGYLLLLEIFLRPIITVFALIAAIGIFSAMVYMLNDTLEFIMFIEGRMDLARLAGGDGVGSARGVIDAFFFTIVYILLVYMLANSCFQIIDKIPNGFMRWFGSGAKSFAQITYAKDQPSSQFTTNMLVAVGDPARRLIDKVDDAVFDVSKEAATQANAGTVTSAVPEGTIARSIHNILGKDRQTRVGEMVESGITSLTETHATSKYEAKKLEKAAAKAETPQKREDLLKQAKEMKLRAEATDPELLYQELLNPRSSSISREARELLDDNGNNLFEQSLKALKETRDKSHPTLADLLQSQTEARGGFYADNGQVQGAMANVISTQKKSIIARLKKNKVIE